MKKNKKRIIIAIISIIIVGLLIYFHPWTNGLPLYGWRYSEEITTDFYQQYVPDGWVGYGWRVYVDSETQQSFKIKVYGRPATLFSWWNLEGEGTYTAGVFKWIWEDFPW